MIISLPQSTAGHMPLCLHMEGLPIFTILGGMVGNHRVQHVTPVTILPITDLLLLLQRYIHPNGDGYSAIGWSPEPRSSFSRVRAVRESEVGCERKIVLHPLADCGSHSTNMITVKRVWKPTLKGRHMLSQTFFKALKRNHHTYIFFA